MLGKGRRFVNWFHGELGVDGLFLIVRVRNHPSPGQCRAGRVWDQGWQASATWGVLTDQVPPLARAGL